MCKDIEIKEERISSIEYIEFLKRTDLGSQYPKERFEERMAKLVDHVSISLIARNKEYIKIDRDKSTFKSHRDFDSEIEMTFKHF